MMDFELTKGQVEAVDIVCKRYIDGKRYAVINGFAGVGKAQPNDTTIPTPNGYKKLGDLKIGDYVYDRCGKPTKVTGIYPQGELEVFKVTLADGRETLCNDEHIWTSYTSRDNFKNRTCKQMLKEGLKDTCKGGSYRFKIPTHKLIEYEEKDFEIDPYVIGAFLGDGCCKERILTISSEDDEIPNIISKLTGYKFSKNSIHNFNWCFNLDEKDYYKNYRGNALIKHPQTKIFFKNFMDEICVGAEKKRIPEIYKRGSKEQRYALLQGLMDTDGSINSSDGTRFNMKFTSISKQLILDVQEIFYTLGYSNITIHEDKRKDKYTTGLCYNLHINIPNEDKHLFFRLTRKREIAERAAQYHKRKCYWKESIVNIEDLGYKTEMTCIMVDNPEHLYLTNDFIVTHNTTVVNVIIEKLKNQFGIREEQVVYATLTGKASLVLREKGNKNVSTLHKLLYLPQFNHITGKYQFIPKEGLDKDYRIIVCDEASMIPKSMVELLAKTRCFVIFLGDNFQLPPVSADEDNHLLDSPHAQLTEIMRQENESEIIQVATAVREGKRLKPFKGKEVQIIKKDELSQGMLDWADQILCAKNDTRQYLNNLMRESLNYKSISPEEGDKIICLHNYWDIISSGYYDTYPLINGTIGIIKTLKPVELYWRRPYVASEITLDTGDKIIFNNLLVDTKLFETGKPTFDPIEQFQMKKNRNLNAKKKIPLQFDYGYAITTWKAQGSEWNKVLVIEEDFPFDVEEHKKFLYTSITRAREKLIIVLKD